MKRGVMQLKKLGWDSHFKRQFRQLQTDNIIPARVISEQKKSYYLQSQQGLLHASARGVFWHEKNTDRIPVVGDWVAVQLLENQQSASIQTVLDRKNQFSRMAAGNRKKTAFSDGSEQIIAANIDLIIVVNGLDRDYNPRRIERFLTLINRSKARAMIILNKADLCSDVENKKNEIERIAPGVQVISMVALDSQQVKVVDDYIEEGETAVLVGSSGVGKSTIINQLIGYQRQKIQLLSTHAGKGRHTTSRRELILLPQGGLIMDNPGIREIQLWADEDDISDTFIDIEKRAIDCRFRDCQHKEEPGCAVKQAVENGDIPASRLHNYQKMKAELNRKSYKRRN